MKQKGSLQRKALGAGIFLFQRPVVLLVKQHAIQRDDSRASHGAGEVGTCDRREGQRIRTDVDGCRLNPNIHIHRAIRRKDHRIAAIWKAACVDTYIAWSPVF